MKLKQPTHSPARASKQQQFLLLAIAVTLIALNIHIFAHSDKNLKGISAIFGLAVLSLLWDSRQTLVIGSGRASRVMGGLLIALVLSQSMFWSQVDPLFQITPFLSALGLGLIASGRQLKQYSRELMLLFALAIPFETLISHLFNLATLTAQYASLILWYLGFSASQQGTHVVLPTGAVEVAATCSGLNVIGQMLRLAILHNVMFPGRWLRDIFVTVVAVLIGFTGNAIRVDVLAILVAAKNWEQFEYFHGPGGHIFTVTSALIFGLFCYVIMQMTHSSGQTNPDSSNTARF